MPATVIDPADAMQAWIEGIQEKISRAPLTRDEAFGMALGRTASVMMENVAELRLMADDATCSEIEKANAGLLATVYALVVEETLFNVEQVMARQRRVVIPR